MWFKQVQVFNLHLPLSKEVNVIEEKLAALAFKACLPSLPAAMGWIAPIDTTETLIRRINGCILISLQIEEKLLPSTVVNHHLKEKVKEIEAREDRKLSSKEKLRFRDEILFTLLPRAFSKYSQIFAYLDTENNWLILNTSSPMRTEQFMGFFKKTFGDVVKPFELVKTSSILTRWLQQHNYPKNFSIEKTCVLQDPNQQNRVIRCQQQDLFAASILALIKDGCEVMQIALCWQDRINLLLAENFMLRNVRLAEDDTIGSDEYETKQQKFDADFVMMTLMFRDLIKDLLKVFMKKEIKPEYALVG